jgi:UDP-glucose:(heptosyl)LPS alpha-1,3-glucosyltransferase
LRITIVSESFDERRGGAERCAAALAGILAARGHDVSRLERDPARSRVLGAIALARAAERARAPGLVLSLCKAPGDVVFPQEGVHIAAMAAALRRHTPLVRAAAAALKLLSPKQWAFLAAEGGGGRGPARGSISGRLVVGRARPSTPRRYIALSRRIRDDMVAHWSAPPDAIEVVPNGIDVQRFAPPAPEERAAARAALGLPGDPAERLAVLFISNNFALRGLDRLIRAVAIANLRARLVVAGRDAPHRYAALARGLGVDVDFRGWVDDVRPLMRAADVLAHPTFYDACSLVTLEALGQGLPVVTTRQNGAAEIMSGREGVILEDAARTGALAAALARLADPARRADCGAASRETALANPIARPRARVVELLEDASR